MSNKTSPLPSTSQGQYPRINNRSKYGVTKRINLRLKYIPSPDWHDLRTVSPKPAGRRDRIRAGVQKRKFEEI